MSDELALPSIRCVRAAHQIKMDGTLTDLPWLTSEAVSLQLNGGGDPVYGASVRVFRDDQCLYIGFACDDPEPSGSMVQRDDPLFNDGNVVEVFIDPSGEGKTFYEFEVNPLNTLLDLYYEALGQPWKQAARWNAQGIRTAVTIQYDEDDSPIGWCVTLAIPWGNFTTADRTPPQTGDVWRINFYRYNTWHTGSVSHLELSAWSRTLSEKFDVPSRFGYIRF